MHSSSMNQLNSIKASSSNNLKVTNNNLKKQNPINNSQNFLHYHPNPALNSAYIINNPKKQHKTNSNSNNTSITIV